MLMGTDLKFPKSSFLYVTCQRLYLEGNFNFALLRLPVARSSPSFLRELSIALAIRAGTGFSRSSRS